MGPPSSEVWGWRLAATAAPVLVAVVVVLLAHPARGRAAVATGTADGAGGERLYQRDCGFCHGAAGEGTARGPSLHNIGPAEVDYAVSTGRMPIEEPGDVRQRREVRYGREEIEALIAFMRPFLAPQPDIPTVHPEAGDLAEGAKLYQAECAACHQSAGAGGGLLGREAPSLFDATPLQVAEAIRSGPMTMPEYGPNVLSDHEVDSIVRYVAELQGPENRGGHPIWHLGPLPEGLIAWVVGMGLLIMAVKWIGERR